MRALDPARVLAAQDAVPEAVHPASRAWWVEMARIQALLEQRRRERGRPRYLAELPPWLASGVAWRA